MNLTNYLVLGIIYFITSSTSFSFGIGYFTLYRSIFSGLLTGMALGNPALGLFTGAISNLLFIDFTSTGGSLKGDPCLTGILASMIAIKLNIMPAAALALALPASLIGLSLWKYRLVFNSIFINNLRKKIKNSPVSSLIFNNVVGPQSALLAASIAVFAFTALILMKITSFILLKIPSLEILLNTTGIVLIILAASSAALWFKYKYNIVMFTLAYLIAVYFNFDPYLILILILIISAQKREVFKIEKYKSDKITRKELIKSWAIWMNFTHSCYSYEMLQGVAYSHSMIPIMKKLYKGRKTEREDSITRHFEFFNTEPNVGTAIHGYIIQMEDRKLSDKLITDIIISDTKKGLMGAVAGMGDFTTQTIIAPILILGMIYGVVSNEIAFFALSALLMVGAVTYLSLKGYFDGFYYGEEGVLRRVNLPKDIKFFKYSHKIFIVLMGLVVGETMVGLLSIMKITTIPNSAAALVILFIIFNYMLRKGLKLKVIIISLYVLNLFFLIIV